MPFDDIELHGPVLRDAISVDFVVIMNADDEQAQQALEYPRLETLEVCRHLELGNLDTSPLRLALAEAEAALIKDVSTLGWRAGEAYCIGATWKRASLASETAAITALNSAVDAPR